MRRIFVLALLLFAFSGCSDRNSSPYKAAFTPAPAPAPAAAPSAAEPSADKKDLRRKFLAYEHAVQVETEAQKVAALYEAVQAKCERLAEEGCVILRSSLAGGETQAANLTLRANAAGIRQLTALLGSEGTVVNRSMAAEDLANPIEDSARKLAMLADYRTRLEGLRSQAGAKLETLIEINRELAKVQSDIEARTGERAQLFKRVETEILNISISSTRQSSTWAPISEALSRFNNNFAQALSSTITFVAYLVPFGLLFLICLWVLRAVWVRWRRPRAKA